MHKLEKKQRVFAILQLHAMKHQTTHQIQNLIQLPLQSISSITRSKKKKHRVVVYQEPISFQRLTPGLPFLLRKTTNQ